MVVVDMLERRVFELVSRKQRSLKLSNLEEESKKVEVLKITLITVHELAKKTPYFLNEDLQKMIVLIEQTFDKLHMTRKLGE
jgi:hypothetical protein